MTPKPSGTDHSANRLLRILGLSFGIAVVIGCTIGVGILKAPGQMAAELGSIWLALVIWIAISLYALLGTSIMAEVATAIPKAGAWYTYAERAFGAGAGFTIGWINWLMLASTAATLAVAIGEFLGQLVPTTAPFQKSTALVVLGAFAVLQWAGTRSSGRAQEITSAAKALAFIALIIACFALGGGENVALREPVLADAPHGTALIAGIVAALQIVIFAFDGWYGAIYFAEEDKDPNRNLPRAMVFGTLAVIAIYLLVNFAIWWVLPLADIAAAGRSGELAAAAAARALFGAVGSDIILLVSLVAVPSVLNATMLQGTRVLYSLGRDGMSWHGFGLVNPRGTPTRALLATTAVAMGLIVGSQGLFDRLLAITSFFFAIVYLSGFVSMWTLRHRAPDMPRPYRAWGHPWSTCYVVAVSVVFLGGALYADTENSLWAMALIAVSFPAYHFLRRVRLVAPQGT